MTEIWSHKDAYGDVARIERTGNPAAPLRAVVAPDGEDTYSFDIPAAHVPAVAAFLAAGAEAELNVPELRGPHLNLEWGEEGRLYFRVHGHAPNGGVDYDIVYVDARDAQSALADVFASDLRQSTAAEAPADEDNDDLAGLDPKRIRALELAAEWLPLGHNGADLIATAEFLLGE